MDSGIHSRVDSGVDSGRYSGVDSGVYDLIDAMVELRGRRIDTSKRTPWGCSTTNLNGRAWVVVLAHGSFSSVHRQK